MKNMKFIAVTALLVFGYLQVYAQTVNVSRVWAEEQNQYIAVHYTLTAGQPTHISLQYSFDNGRNWFDCRSVTGDLRSQTTGNKIIFWDCQKDGFEKGSLLFRVVADERTNSSLSSSSMRRSYRENTYGIEMGVGARKMNEWGTFLDITVRYTFNFSPHIGWDVVNLRIQELVKAPALENSLIQIMTGLRVYTQAFSKDMKGYGSLKAGYGFQPYLGASGFTYELEAGFHLTRTFFMGLVYNGQNLQGELEGLDFNLSCAYVGLRFGFNF